MQVATILDAASDTKTNVPCRDYVLAHSARALSFESFGMLGLR